MDPDIQAAFGGASTAAAPPPANYDPDVAAAFQTPGTLKTWTGSPQEKEGLTNQTPIGYGLGLANSWMGKELQKGAQKIGITDPSSLRDVGNLPVAIETVAGARVSPKLPEAEAPDVNTAQAALNARAAQSPQSMGAASAAPQLSGATPELQQAVANATRTNGGAVNPDALARHIEADSLPVPVQLTRGQATQDPHILSLEQNRRAALPGLSDRFNQQNSALIQNLDAIRDQIGPDVNTGNTVEHGEALIQAYKDKADAANADISSKYQALKDANGGAFPVDAYTLQNNVSSALHQNMLFEHAPDAVMNQLQNASKNGMSFEQYEAMRTNLARTIRSSSDGNERAAAGVIRQQLEDLPMTGPNATVLKPLADTARAAARTQFQALDNDPAYKAAVNDSVPADRFVNKFVVNAPKADVDTMRQNFAGNDTMQQTISVGALDRLRQASGADNGNFSQAGFNKQLQVLGPKLGQLFDPKTQETLQTLGNVAKNTQFQPKGSYVNNSNTAVSAAGEMAKGAAEAAVNLKTLGIGGTLIRKALTGRAAKQFANKSLEPGAGVGDLQ